MFSGRTARRLVEKIAELDTYTELLSKQALQLQNYFDMCVSTYPQIQDDAAEAIDAVKLADGNLFYLFINFYVNKQYIINLIHMHI